MMYFHTWELDPEQPKLNGVPLLSRIRQYRNLDKMRGILQHYLHQYRFASIAEHLGLDGGELAAVHPGERAPAGTMRGAAPSVPGRARLPVTVVVTCYNEELILPYLSNTLRGVEQTLGDTYDLRFVFVDDGSSDGTWSSLERTFGSRANCLAVRHPSNQGVAAAIMTGIRAATSEVVCSIDCDCTYDPNELRAMIPLLADGIDLVTASPYHPLGSVRNVPAWRLTLSRTLSGMYRLILHQKLATYTSCFRVYRRSAALLLRVERSGFLGVAEMLGRLDLAGGRIVEHPARLEARLLGRSKMKVLGTILGHLGLWASLAAERVRSPRKASAAPGPADVSSQTT